MASNLRVTAPRMACSLAVGLVAAVPTLHSGDPQDRPDNLQGRAASSTVPGEVAEGSSWPSFRGDPAQRGVAPGSLAVDLIQLWRFQAPKPVTSSPVVAEGIVYFGCDDGALYAIDFETGEERWHAFTGLENATGEIESDFLEAPPLVLEGRVSIGSNDGVVYTFDALTGEPRWQFATEGKILAGVNHWRFPDEEFTRLYVGSYDNNLYCLRADDGTQLWSYATDNYVNGTPAVADGKVVFGGCDCVLHVVDGRSGEALRKVELGGSANVAGSVAVDDGAAWFGHYSNAFLGVDLETGAPRWVYADSTQPFVAAPAVAAGRVVFGGDDRFLHCLDQRTGEVLWQFRTRKKLGAAAVVCDGKVVVGTADGRAYLLDLVSGEELWTFEVGKSIVASPAVCAGRIILASLDGGVYAFGSAGNASRSAGDGAR